MRMLFLALFATTVAGSSIRIDDCANRVYTARGVYSGDGVSVFIRNEYVGNVKLNTIPGQSLVDVAFCNEVERSVDYFCTKYAEVIRSYEQYVECFIYSVLMVMIIFTIVSLTRCFLYVRKIKNLEHCKSQNIII